MRERVVEAYSRLLALDMDITGSLAHPSSAKMSRIILEFTESGFKSAKFLDLDPFLSVGIPDKF